MAKPARVLVLLALAACVAAPLARAQDASQATCTGHAPPDAGLPPADVDTHALLLPAPHGARGGGPGTTTRGSGSEDFSGGSSPRDAG